MSDLPQPIAELVDPVAAMPGTVAVVLGGSRALGSNDGSDWDLGVYSLQCSVFDVVVHLVAR